MYPVTLLGWNFSFLFIFSCACAFSAEENFLLINGITGETVLERGGHIQERITPCSTFKIVLSLMGYDAEILQDENNPTWAFQENYDDYLESWKAPQTPRSWMLHSCLWFSKMIAGQLGMEKMQSYLASLAYGNQDMSGGLTTAWLSSTLKISPQEQVKFLQKLVRGVLPVSNRAIQLTRLLIFKEDLPEGWKLFGKTGWSGSIKEADGYAFQIGWFVGWIEREQAFFPFAYNIREEKINLAARIPRVKQLLAESEVMAASKP